MLSIERERSGAGWVYGVDAGRGKLRKAGRRRTQPVRHGWPNGETRWGASLIITSQDVKRTEGTETSQYLEEEKSTEMPRVAASEIGGAQTDLLVGSGL